MTHNHLDVARIIRQKGRRLTPQRQLILDAVCAGNGHTTLEEIYQRAQHHDPGINLATVYRSLDFLCELRLVVAADTGGGRMVFEIAGEVPHHHLVCRTCGGVERIEQQELQPLIEQIDRGHAFRVDMDHIALFGLCQNCQKRPDEQVLNKI
jgi:Fur family ferric uptake transcriptional regulator